MSVELAVEILFWLLVIAVLQPLRIDVAVVGFLVLAHLDMSGQGFSSARAVGLQNALKGLLLPAWLCLWSWVLARRAAVAGNGPKRGLAYFCTRPQAALWAAFMAYAALSTVWSPFRLSGLKLIGALFSHTLVFFAFLGLWLAGKAVHRMIFWSIPLIIGLALMQTYLFGSYSLINEWAVHRRFTSFSSAQGFAAGIVALFAVLLWRPRWGLVGQSTTCVLMLVVTWASGSRIGFLGALCAIAVWLLSRLDLQRLVVIVAGLGLLLSLLLVPAVRGRLADSRVGELLRFERGFRAGAMQIETFRWRIELYDCILDDYGSKRLQRRLLGSGSASTGRAGLACKSQYDERTFSPTRVAHNEPLRFLYEWGVIGLGTAVVFLTVLLWLFVRSLQIVRRCGPAWAVHFGPFLSVTPMLILTFALENVLQAASRPADVGFLLVLAQVSAGFALLAEHRQHLDREVSQDPRSYDVLSSPAPG